VPGLRAIVGHLLLRRAGIGRTLLHVTARGGSERKGASEIIAENEAAVAELDAKGLYPRHDPDAAVLDVGPAAIWVQQRIDPDWCVAYRLLAQRGGPVVAEVRVFPYEPSAGHGRWSGTACPPGGLPARVLRKVRATTPLIGLGREERRRLLERSTEDGMGAVLGRLGFDDAETSPSVDRLRARVAATYALVTEDVKRGSIEIVARLLSYSPTYVRDLVHDARRTEILSPTRRGRAGGALTKKGRALLSPAEFEELEQRVAQWFDDTTRRSKR
jgi:molybdenum-dependent DNA-binding transcriptional regulator ModE